MTNQNLYGHTYLKRKGEVFKKFMKWKFMMENSRGQKIKTSCIDNGGEYTSREFGDYLRKKGMS